MKKIILSATFLVVLVSCDATKKSVAETSKPQTNEPVTKPPLALRKNQTIDLDYLNTSVRPQDDFFEFSNGAWIKDNPVPASESRWGSFNELDQANKKKLTAILEEAKALNVEQGTIMQILGAYYASFVDTTLRDAKGLDPIQEEMNSINEINSKKDLSSIIAVHHAIGIPSLFRFGIRQDLKDVDHHIASFSQGGIGLPNKDYYLSADKKELLKEYTDHIDAMFMLMGNSKEDAALISKSVILIEMQLAESMMAPAELRIPEKTYNKHSLRDFSEKVKPFDFQEYLRQTHMESFDTLVVGQVEFAENMGRMILEVELEDWKNYLSWKVLNHYASHLDSKFVNQNFAFYGKTLSGKSKLKPQNELAIDEITHLPIGELLGKTFVGRHYSDVSQQRVNEMVDNLVMVFRKRIMQLEWMSEETKIEAKGKLNAIGRKLGFPSKWEDFSSLRLSPDDYIGNYRQIEQFSRRKNLDKINKDVDKDEWGMPAHMVNAYYHPLLNEIAFPAGIMQVPFFSENYEDAVNYGRIGMVIGHEFTHGFDDMGSKFASDGTFRNWWSEEDRKAFEERTTKLGNTFAKFCPVEGHCVNPDLTMGENIADLGGLTLAYHAYTKTEEYKLGVVRDGFTPAQRFFIAYAQLWKINYTQEELKKRVANDPHSPGMYRVNGPLMNCPEFFEAFNVSESDPMRNSTSTISKIW